MTDGRLSSPLSNVGPLASGVAVATTGVLPLFLTSALAVQIRADIGFSASGLGVATAAFFGTGAIVSVAGGRMSERLGAAAAMRWAVATSGAVLVSIALVVQSLGVLIVFMALGGVANALVQPATTLYLSRAVPENRLGLAFGVKQASIPAAGMIGGLAVPLVAGSVGWRWAFVVCGVASFGICSLGLRNGGGQAPRSRDRGHSDAAGFPMVLLAIGGGLGTAGASSLGVFLASAGVEVGLSEGAAGLVVASSSFLGLVVRVGFGIAADRRRGRLLVVVALMMWFGTLGYAALAANSLPLFVIGAPIAFAMGWGWAGLFILAVVRLNPIAPAAATGVTQTGMMSGAVFGPLAFGMVADRESYALAWSGSAISLLVAGITLLLSRWVILKRRAIQGDGNSTSTASVPPSPLSLVARRSTGPDAQRGS